MSLKLSTEETHRIQKLSLFVRVHSAALTRSFDINIPWPCATNRSESLGPNAVITQSTLLISD
jgi:hypothetical protein